MLSAAARRLEAQELIGASIAVLALALTPTATSAQVAPAAATTTDPAVRSRAEGLVALLAGKPGYDSAFTAPFRAAVPRERFDAIVRQLQGTLGAPQRVQALQPLNRWAATVTIGYARGTATMRLALDPAAPHAVAGLLVTATALRGDTVDKVCADLAALPGVAHLGVYAIDSAEPQPVFAVRGDDPAPLGSAFKLWVLAETARQVAAGKRRWNEVVPVGAPSLPSGILQRWPAGTPVTVQTLATLMISISDNTAADTLMTLLGREAVDAAAARFGGAGPVLTTREAFVIKGDPALVAAWTAGDPERRRALLARERDRIAAARIDPMMFSGKPVAVDAVEWFSSPRDMARLLADLRDAGPVVRAILAVNPGIDPGVARRFDYIGYKGGSEPGVIALDLLARTRNGRWLAVSASWHRADAAVDEVAFAGLVTRALALVAD